MDFSVVICTHNPRPHYLRRVLQALRGQTMPMTRWELLVVDNASREPLAPTWDLSWHPHARHLREERLGLIHARTRGIRESRGGILVFVDDDNVLAENYLETADGLLRQWPLFGVVGTGFAEGEFEVQPAKSIEYYVHGLVVWNMQKDHWINFGANSFGLAAGAGMCVRREVAEDFLHKTEADPLRQALGRAGPVLGAGEDQLLCFSAHDLGLGCGRFVALKLIHLIPRERVSEEYIARLFAGFEWAEEFLHFIRQGKLRIQSRTPARQLKYFFRLCTWRGIARRVFIAEQKARADARRSLLQTSRARADKAAPRTTVCP